VLVLLAGVGEQVLVVQLVVVEVGVDEVSEVGEPEEESEDEEPVGDTETPLEELVVEDALEVLKAVAPVCCCCCCCGC